ncbi:MAG: NAD(FAD)-utilizing dehydrogenase, partial [Alphaproteobacteria bacterium]|nr:NAD(FAD)-utilizing dehydrogenase [Alphaproteobacteria bacterium]
MYRIHQIKLRWDEPLEEIPRKIGKKLGWKGNHPEILEWVIRKESIDARDKSQIFRVYTIDFQPLEPFKQGKDGLVELVKEDPWMPPPYGEKQLEHSPVIVGFGPAGMFAALVLSEAGFHPVILERGASMEDRIHKVNQFWRDGILDEETNVQFGEGGAGTFSDGKLTTGIRDVRIQKVLKELVEAGANPNILYKQKPHVGTDVLRKVVVEIREKIKRAGGSFQFQTKLTDLVFEEGRIMGVQMGEKGTIPTESLVLAIGHSARDTQE